MMTEKRFAKSADAKRAGWFSKRHETSEAHIESTERHRRKKGERRKRAEERQHDHNLLSTEEKLEKAIRNGHRDSKEAKRLREQLKEERQAKGREKK